MERMIFSDRWYIEGKKAWFLSATRNELFAADLKKKEIHLLARIPNGKGYTWRDTTHCFKADRQIVCLPDLGNSIWKYSLDSSKWKEIPINAPMGVRLGISQYWTLDKVFLLYSPGLCSILHFSVERNSVLNSDVVASESEEQLGRAVRVGDEIYIVSSVSPKIYCYQISSGRMKSIPLRGVDEGLHAICYDGKGFWLSGKKRKFYRWLEGEDDVRIYDLPPTFGVYNFDFPKSPSLDTEAETYQFPTFFDIVYVNDQSWFIPGQTNQILYMDADSSCVNELHIPEEDENSTSTQHRVLDHKYMVLYIRDDRYIGLYSCKNACVLEIDAKKKSYEILQYDLNSIPFSFYGFRKEFSREFLPWLCRDLFFQNNSIKQDQPIILSGRDIYRAAMEDK